MSSLPSSPFEPIQIIIQAALTAADPYKVVLQNLQRHNNILKIKDEAFDLTNGRLFIVSLGKAAVPMAKAVLDSVKGTAVFGGLVAKFVPDSWSSSLPIYLGNHPVPGDESIAATAVILQTLKQTTANDLVLCLISGGASALFTKPRLPLADWQKLNAALLASGCPIQAVNMVRRQLDAVKAGGLAQFAAPAKVMSLILSDVVGNDLAAIGSGPTVAINETPADALAILQQYRVANYLDTDVAEKVHFTLKNLEETALALPNNILSNTLVGSIQQSAAAAAEAAKALDFQTQLLTTHLEGEAKEAGKLAAAIAKDAPPQSAVILGGETTVTLSGNGKGGRNLETALAAAIALAGWPNRLIATFATDGDDAATGMAGAIVTGETIKNPQDAQSYLQNNDSYTYFEALEQESGTKHFIQTGPTGTNVNDLLIILHV